MFRLFVRFAFGQWRPARRAPARLMPRVRLEAYHAASPRRRVLVSVDTAASREELHDAIAIRLGIKPERCCLGETEAEVTSASDLREGDVLRVVRPDLPNDDAAEADEQEPTALWRAIVRGILTLVIFVILEEIFQQRVYRRYFRHGPEHFPPTKMEDKDLVEPDY